MVRRQRFQRGGPNDPGAQGLDMLLVVLALHPQNVLVVLALHAELVLVVPMSSITIDDSALRLASVTLRWAK